MNYSDAYFDEYQERRGSGSVKWDGCHEKFHVDSDTELVPMWIADMDFRSPVEVQNALVERAHFGSYGYVLKGNNFYRSIISWIKRQYHWDVQKDWIVFTPGVIPGLHIAIQSLTQPGDGVIVQPPVYYPFMIGVEVNGRKLIKNQLIEDGGDWFMDFDDLEKKVKEPKTKLMLLCNPHNPVGRVWTKEELARLSKLCADNNVILLTDEIHADLMMKGYSHNAVNAVCEKRKNNTITYYAPSKTFNLAGLQTAIAVIPDKKIREQFLNGLNVNRIFNINWFGTIATETAWTECDQYVDALCSYINDNMDYMMNYLAEKIPILKMYKPQATYMAFIDFRGTKMNTRQIEEFIVKKAHIGVDMGSWFGDGGAGYLRFNLACPRKTLTKALEQLEEAVNNQILRNTNEITEI